MKIGDVLREIDGTSDGIRDVVIAACPDPTMFTGADELIWAWYRYPGEADWRGPWHGIKEGEAEPHPQAEQVWAEFVAWQLTQ